jgi:acyl dehydratase
MADAAPVWRRELDALPSLRRALAAAAFRRKRGLPAEAKLGRFEASIARLTIEPDHIARYREVCQCAAPVPVTYPQLLATYLHVAMLTSREFPLPAMGLVHPRVQLIQHRPLAAGEDIALRCWIDGHREVAHGIEFDMEAEVRVGDELVWQSTAATFSRRGSRAGSKQDAAAAAEAPAAKPTWQQVQELACAAAAGRQYASVSGDYNPVHLHPWLAKMFGYRRPIAHGWWLLARCLGALSRDAGAGKLTVNARLLRPVFLPSTLAIASSVEGQEHRFSLQDPDEAAKPRVVGSIVTG